MSIQAADRAAEQAKEARQKSKELTRIEMIAICTTHGRKGVSKMSKADLIELLKNNGWM